MRIILTCLFIASLLGCEPEKPRVEDTMFQHATQYTDQAEEAETQTMEGAAARREAIEEQER